MGKKKQFLQGGRSKPAEQGKRQPPGPDTEDEFLEAADEFEQAGGKWKAGDPVKATRFFVRARDTYSQGVQRFPKSFDLAYNKALLDYQITQDPRIAACFGKGTEELLHEALEAHEYALSLNENNIDLIFNTAHVLSDLAKNSGKIVSDDSIKRAVKLMRRCLELQLGEHDSLQAALQAANSGDAPSGVAAEKSTPQPASAPAGSDEYATVEKAVTEQDILDSVIALTGMVTDLLPAVIIREGGSVPEDVNFVINLYNSGSLTAYLDKLDKEEPESAKTPSISLTLSTSNPTQEEKSPYEETKKELQLAHANLSAAVSDTQFRCMLRCSAHAYYTSILGAYNNVAPGIDTSCALADALGTFAASVGGVQGFISVTSDDAATLVYPPPAAPSSDAKALMDNPPETIPTPILWTSALHVAHYVLMSVLAAPTLHAFKKPQILIALGDVHWRLAGLAGLGSNFWMEGSKLAEATGAHCEDELVEGAAKHKIAAIMRGEKATGFGGLEMQALEDALDQMVEQGLLTERDQSKISELIGL